MEIYEIDRYSASHPDWEGSFSERLYEYCEWNKVEFWKLHKELTDLAVWLRTEDKMDKDLVGKILGIQRSIWSVVAAHFNKNDVVELTGVTNDELYGFIERFDMAIKALTTGEILPECKFDLVSPLLK
ncbi:MAG: immunity 41 family protein [Pseudomonadales bacterium]|nr:immunity 41 family protein [Pseudomonadales bacterium]